MGRSDGLEVKTEGAVAMLDGQQLAEIPHGQLLVFVPHDEFVGETDHADR